MEDNPVWQAICGIAAVVFWLATMALWAGVPVLIGLFVLDLLGIVDVW